MTTRDPNTLMMFAATMASLGQVRRPVRYRKGPPPKPRASQKKREKRKAQRRARRVNRRRT